MSDEKLIEYLIQRIEAIDAKVDDLRDSLNEKMDQNNACLTKKINSLLFLRSRLFGAFAVISAIMTLFIQAAMSYFTQ